MSVRTRAHVQMIIPVVSWHLETTDVVHIQRCVDAVSFGLLWKLHVIIMPIGKGEISIAFVHPSVHLCVHPSHTYQIIREPKGIACPNLEGQFPTLDVTCIPVSRSNGQRSGSPGPLMLRHIVHHIFQAARPTNFKFGVRVEDDDHHQPQAP